MNTINFNEKETLSLRKLTLELRSLSKEINKARAFNEIPNAESTIRALEISEILSRYFNS